MGRLSLAAGLRMRAGVATLFRPPRPGQPNLIHAKISPTFESFRDCARALLAASVAPNDVMWDDGAGQLSLFFAGGTLPPALAEDAPPLHVPSAFVIDGELVARHTDPGRWALLYRIVHRLTNGEPSLLALASDPDVARLRKLATAVRRTSKAKPVPMPPRETSARVLELTGRVVSASHAWIPAKVGRDELARAAQGCRGCGIWEHATQAVFGEGPSTARLVLVGEQPGDQEDLAGHPFVGPAGEVLDQVLFRAGVPRSEVYVTNAVKHFKWEPRGKRRLHSRPNPVEVQACRGWLDAEMSLLKPEVVVCLGATAARALYSQDFRMGKQRGRLLDGRPWAKHLLATHHPSSVLRAEEDSDADRIRDELIADLAYAVSLIEGPLSRSVG